MSDSKFFNEALDALYNAAKASANFVEAALTSKDPDFNSADKERLKVALSVLKITWSDAEGDDENENEDENEDDEYEYEYDDDDEFESPHAPSNN
jgi:hypothetical protein